MLTHAQLADWLKVSERTLDRLDLPTLPLTEGVRRYMVREVLAEFEARRRAAEGSPALAVSQTG